MASRKSDGKQQPSEVLLAILASNVRELRKQQGLTQEALGEKCNFHPTFISLFERKQRNVTISTLEITAQALGVEAFKLIKI